jgi:hypothetical protein
MVRCLACDHEIGLTQVILTDSSFGPLQCLTGGWEQHGCQDPDNGNHHQELNQGHAAMMDRPSAFHQLQSQPIDDFKNGKAITGLLVLG